MIKLFVGLGNPGLQYEATRHNAGFWWLAQLAERLGASLTMDKAYQGCVARVQKDGAARWLLTPQTFMNLSGHSVAALAHFYKIAPSEILIVHDELDLAPGTIKLKFGGGHAGHNGLKSTHAQLATPDYWRLRVGIGHPGDKALVHGWVLGKPSGGDRQVIDRAIDHSLDALPEMLAGDMRAAMQHIHAPVAG